MIQPDDLGWIEGEDAGDDSGLGCNRDSRDLRATTRADVDEVIEIERRMLEQSETLGFMASHDTQDLDIGVTGATLALAATGCIPFTSCNGGALGGRHQAQYLLVAFYLAIGAVEPTMMTEPVAAGPFR